MVDNIVEVIDVVKKYKNESVLNKISISFERGKIHGIIGRNGSGKTVLFKCICGFLNIDLGKILINGKCVKPSKAQDIGIIIETPGFIRSLSGFKNLKLLSSINKKISNYEINETLKIVGLDPKNKKNVNTYSLGMKHRLGIAQAIMEKPKLLILDEPMNGLDKQGVIEIRELFKKLNKEGLTIILSSHYVEDIEFLCDTVTELDRGVIINNKK